MRDPKVRKNPTRDLRRFQEISGTEAVVSQEARNADGNDTRFTGSTGQTFETVSKKAVRDRKRLAIGDKLKKTV